MLNQEKSGFHLAVVIAQFFSEGHSKGEGVVIDRFEYRRIN